MLPLFVHLGGTYQAVGLRKAYSATLLAIRRNSQMLSNPARDLHFCDSYLLVGIRQPDKIVEVMDLFDNPERYDNWYMMEDDRFERILQQTSKNRPR